MAGQIASPVPKWKRAFAGGVSILAFGCARGVPAPSFPTPFDATPPTSILGYVDKLKFDERDGASHKERLLIGCPDACRFGPEVLATPEKRNHNNEDEDLATGPGRIVARFINLGKERYEPLKLEPGDTIYWAVDSVRRVSNTLSQGRSLYISKKALRTGQRGVVKTRPLTIDKHPGQEKLNMSIVRWIFDTTGYDEDKYEKRAPGGGSTQPERYWIMATWGNCVKIGCCH